MTALERLRRRRKRLGARGESDACCLLESKAYEILTRNYRTRHGEIDVVARDGAVLVFVEVKTRRSAVGRRPESNWSGAQRARLERCALDYMKRLELSGAAYRFELIEVVRSDFFLRAIRHRRANLAQWYRRRR